jgi:hypothetical protein
LFHARARRSRTVLFCQAPPRAVRTPRSFSALTGLAQYAFTASYWRPCRADSLVNNVTGGAVAVGIGFQWGNGTLTYQGQQYPFRVQGLTVADIGVTRSTGSGTVRNLHNVADFSGNYVAVSVGAALAGGGSVMTLRNQNGVVIDGATTAQGVRLMVAPGGVNITTFGSILDSRPRRSAEVDTGRRDLARPAVSRT